MNIGPSLKIEISYTVTEQTKDGPLNVYRDDTVFLRDIDPNTWPVDPPELQYVRRMLKKKDVRAALIRSDPVGHSYIFTPIFRMDSEVNQTVTLIHWYKDERRYFNSGTVSTIKDALEQVVNEMYHIAEQTA